MNKYLILTLLSAAVLFAQPVRQNGNQSLIFPFVVPFQSVNIIVHSTGDDFNFYYVYKIAYNQLVFERNDSSYEAALRVLVEIADSSGEIVHRDIRDTGIEVDNFEATGERNLFLGDFLHFKLFRGNYSVIATVTDLNSFKEFKPVPVELRLAGDKTETIMQPFLIETAEISCGLENSFKLANFGSLIPFSPKDFHLVIPVTDTSASNISLLIINDKDTLIKQQSNEAYVIPLTVSKCLNDLVIVSGSGSRATKNFVFRNINRNLNEGEIKLVVGISDTLIREFDARVTWIDKPFSLMDPEAAIEALRFIEDDSVIKRMLDSDESEYYKILNDYWKPLDPTKGTSFNQLMFEYYKRVDYAFKEFRGLGKPDGTKSDRGMIYIRFGKPESVERSSNTQGQVTETWYYKNPERKFIFVDERGMGNFTLIDK